MTGMDLLMMYTACGGLVLCAVVMRRLTDRRIEREATEIRRDFLALRDRTAHLETAVAVHRIGHQVAAEMAEQPEPEPSDRPYREAMCTHCGQAIRPKET